MQRQLNEGQIGELNKDMLGTKSEKKREQAAMEGQRLNWRMEIDALGLQGEKPTNRITI